MSESGAGEFPALADRYRVDRELGRGGMATVYLAHDTRHDRKVALKVLHPDLAAALGGQRFLAEIRTTANLQHPHIVPLHDSGESDGKLYYVMPFVEGESLRQRLEREQLLPIEDAILIASEVADALDYAHSHGVVHRDIKPENILLHRGHAMVADFGIALAVQQAGTARMTQTGLSLGTPQYMSPEQAMGESKIGPRADVYALGAVTYEMLVGEPPFTGASLQAIVAKLLTEEPRSLTAQRKSVPPQVEAAVLKALAKIPADRFGSAAEFAAALRGAPVVGERARSSSHWWREISIGLAGVLAILLGTFGRSLRARSHDGAPVPITARVSLEGGTPSNLAEIALSPDASELAFVSSGAFDGGRVWIRSMADGSAHAVAGTEGARYPFWSPDGKSMGFFSNGSLRVVALASGAVRTLAQAPNVAPGAAWGANDDILYTPFFIGLWSVSASGGEPHRFSRTNAIEREPSFFPDGRHFFYWRAQPGRAAEAFVGDLKSGESKLLAKDISSPKYIAPGFVAYFRAGESELEQPGVLFVQKINERKLEMVGDPATLSLRVERPLQYASFTAAGDLVLMREARANAKSHGQDSVFWLNRATGTTTPINGNGPTWTYSIAHHGRSVAFAGLGLWLYDPARDISVRIPTSLAAPWPPVWSPDDREIAVNNESRIEIIPVDSRTLERAVNASDDGTWADPTDWSSDGEIYFVREPAENRPQRELWRHNVASGRNEHVITGPGNIFGARTSPDGKWIAWESDGTGRREIYLGPKAGTPTPLRVSKSGGGTPRWSRGGRELLYVAGDGHIVSVSVQSGDAPVIGDEKQVSKIVNPEPFGVDPFLNTRFDITPAGDRLIVQLPPDPSIYSLTLVQGWQRRLDH